MSGERIGRHHLRAVVGVGAFATVYRAWDERLDVEVALKVLAENRALDPTVRERFTAEGRLLRRVASPHVVAVHDLGETDRQQPYLVLELARHGTLQQRVETLRREGWRPDAASLLAVLLPLTHALEAVHAADVVHRDLSPGNVLVADDPTGGQVDVPPLLTSTERLVLSDLGIAKDLAWSSGLTVAGGTSGFRPPEQEQAPSLVDGRADVWGLGAIGAWLVVGRVPDERGADLHRVLDAHDVPDGVADVLVACLDDDVDERPRTAADARRRLEAVARGPSNGAPARPDGAADAADVSAPGTGRGATSGTDRTPDRGSNGRPGRRRAVLVAVLVVALAASAWLVVAGQPPTPSVVVAEDGTVTSTLVVDDARVVLSGPATVAVGSTAELEVQASAATGWAWLSADGRVVANRPVLRLTPRSGGVVEVRVLVRIGADEVELVHEMDAVE